ncbi:MAG: CAP domain-containing protein [Haloarculaceae archaeon]
MVNKAVLGILVVVVVASLGVGILIGMQLGGGAAPADGGSDGGGCGSDGSGGATTTPTNGTANATATPTNGTANATATPTPATPTPTLTPERTTVPPRRFDEREIALAVVDGINEEIREPRGLATLSGRSRTAGQLSVMADNHSISMADEGKVIHEINGNNSADRYRANDLYDTCKFESNTGEFIVSADDNQLEAIGRTVAGRTYDDGQFNANETAVAQAIVEEWRTSSTYRQPFLYENIEHVGVGVEITRAGDVYVTANVCS